MYEVAECPGRLLNSACQRYRQRVSVGSWPPRPAFGRLHRCLWPTGPDQSAPMGVGPYARSGLTARLEAVLFLGREPLASRRLAQLAGLADGTEARTLVRRLNELYDSEGCAFRVVEVAGGFQLMSRPKFAPWLRRLQTPPEEVRLSGPAMETLSVVAYRQPVLRVEVEAVRGVQCGEILRQLMDRDLVRIAGRSEELGRPFLYGTTKRFLQVFGLRHLDELPECASARRSEDEEEYEEEYEDQAVELEIDTTDTADTDEQQTSDSPSNSPQSEAKEDLT